MMKFGFVLLALVAVTISTVSAQNDMMTTMMLMNALRRGGSQGSSSGGSSSGGNPMAALGGGNPLGMMAATGRMGDAMRDMFMCNMLPGHLRMMCIMRNV